MATMFLCVFAFMCFALLLCTLLWPTRKRKDLPRPTVPQSRWPRVE